ncbi:hypothetical protein ACXO9E_05145 [Lactobacillus delbrueckii subsp. bulgaricus]|nr:hypothetical protein [Lactobacillus delbrueckii subsp. bulgaricus]
MTRVTDQIKTNTQLFLDELWKQSEKGRKSVSINVSEMDKIDQDYKYIVKAYLIYLQKIGCIAYDHDYFGEYYLVTVKRKEVVQ